MNEINSNPKYIPWAKPVFWKNEKAYVNEALDSMWLSGGAFIDKFEHAFSEMSGMKFATTTSNGTTAIHLAFLALDLQPGDDVIIPGFAFLAAANIAIQMGLKPVYAEVDPDTWCLTAAEIEKKMTPKTRAVVAVHTYGNVCPMDEIMALADAEKFWVIEDCAEALFSKYDQKMCGSFGDINTYSFQATKTITTGEGGMVLTDDEEFHKKICLYRNHGLLKRGRYQHVVPGHNFRLTNLQAAIGVAQYEQHEAIIAARKQIHDTYKQCLINEPGVTLQEFTPTVDPVLWAFALKLSVDYFPQGRDRVNEQLKQRGIETRPGFIAPGLMDIYDAGKLAVCETLSHSVISLPTFTELSEDQIHFICHQLLELKS